MCSPNDLIKLTLSNVGRESYQPELYGRRIIVVQRIQKDGSSYKITNVDGNSVCCKFDTRYYNYFMILSKFNVKKYTLFSIMCIVCYCTFSL